MSLETCVSPFLKLEIYQLTHCSLPLGQAAKQVMALLEKVAAAGNIVLFTIHQPSSEIFATFDHLILLNQGQVMYQGDVKNVNEDFAQNGYPVPPNYNPADWILVRDR